MDLRKLIEIAGTLNVPGLAERGVKIASDAVEFAALVKTNAARAGHVLATGTIAEIDAIHAEALTAADVLDGKLAVAEKN
jgi:hypothetical protein